MPLRLLAVFAILTAAAPARANAPAPWGMCRGAKAGDPCDSRYYPRGLCLPEPAGSCPEGAPCLYCSAGADKSFKHDVTPAATSLLGLAGLAALRLVLRKKDA
jgi:hypothetical protein